jgi:hypothetical protein
MKINIILLFVFSLGFALNVFGQIKDITQSEFYAQSRTASAKPFAVSKRITSQEDSYDEQGKISYTTKTSEEYLSSDKMRYVSTYKSDKSTRKDELIKIGETYYCRRNDEEWKQSDSWCAGQSFRALPNAITSKITVEDVKLNNQNAILYQQYITYKNNYSSNGDKEGISYYQSKFWLNKDGFLLRREMESGLLEPSRTYYREVSVYEYDLKSIKIEAPIISKKEKP